MTLLKTMALLVPLIAVPATAMADGNVDCPKVYKKKRKPPAPPKKPPAKPPVKKDCDCVGKEGPPGTPGEKGPPGDPGMTILIRQEAPADGRLAVAIGVMGSVYAVHGDWAWGPALQLRYRTVKNNEVSLAVGYAGFADGTIGSEAGLLVHAEYTKFGIAHLKPLGLSFGAHLTDINGSPDNGETDGYYLAGTIGLVLEKDTAIGNLRLQVGPALAYLKDDVEGKQLGLGLQGSLFLGGNL